MGGDGGEPPKKCFNPSKYDAMVREQMKKDARIFKPAQKMNDKERIAAIHGLNPQLRPRPIVLPKAFSTTALLPTGATMSRLGMGDTVQLAGLRSRNDLNGSCGEVVHDVPDAEGRIRIRLKACKGDPETDKVMRIKKSNLQTMSWGAGAAAQVTELPGMGQSGYTDGSGIKPTWHKEMRKTWSVGDLNDCPLAGGPSNLPNCFSLGTRLMPLAQQRRGFSRSPGGRFSSSALNEVVRIGEAQF